MDGNTVSANSALDFFCGISKYEKLANYFIKVLYGLWHFNDVYRSLEETKA